jgi:prolyl-tRNA synthetase
MGALVMTHSDDNGLILPPKLAPIQVVIVPIYKGEEQLEAISVEVRPVVEALKAKGISVKYDNRDTHKPGFKFNEYELKGVPVRLAIGPRDMENKTFEIARRDTLEKKVIPSDGIVTYISDLLAEMQDAIFDKAAAFRDQHITSVDSYEQFKEVLNSKGGFVLAHWDGTDATEQRIKEETKATIRCIPLDPASDPGECMVTGKASPYRVLFAKAY